MLSGLLLASVFGAFALPEFTRLSDALGLTGGDDDGSNDGPSDDTSAKETDSADDLIDLASDESPDAPEPSIEEPAGVVGDPLANVSDTAPGPESELVDPAPEDDLEILEWDAAPGVTEIDDFDPDAQELALQVPENTTGYLTRAGDPDADPPVPPMLTFEVPDGAVEMRFNGMDAVPVDAISLSAAGGDAVGIASVLLNDVPGLQPDDPEVAAFEGTGIADTGTEDDEVMRPDEGDVPADPVDPEQTASILPDPDPYDALPDDVVAQMPQQITGFDPTTDILEITADPGATLAVQPSSDGSDSDVLVNDALVAVVVAVPDLSADAVQLVSRAA